MDSKGYLFDEPALVHIKVEKELKDAFVAHCRAKGMTFSGLIRILINEYAKKEGII